HRVEAGMHERLSPAHRDHRRPEVGELVEPGQHRREGHRLRGRIVLVAVGAGQVAAAHRHDLGKDGMAAVEEGPHRLGHHPRQPVRPPDDPVHAAKPPGDQFPWNPPMISSVVRVNTDFMANLAAANVMHRKTRTAVSVLAVAVEVAMVMLLVGMANGTLGDIAERLQNVGADVLFQPPDASLILGATSAVMPMQYIPIIKQVDGVREVTPVLNWLVSKIKGESRAVNLWAIDYPSYARISGGLDIVAGRNLAQPNDVIMDTVLAEATGIH